MGGCWKGRPKYVMHSLYLMNKIDGGQCGSIENFSCRQGAETVIPFVLPLNLSDTSTESNAFSQRVTPHCVYFYNLADDTGEVFLSSNPSKNQLAPWALLYQP